MSRQQLCFLTLVARPEGVGRSELARVVADECGLDPATGRLRLARQLPNVIGAFEPEAATRAAARIRQEGGDAFAPSLQALTGLGATRKIKHMQHAGDGFAVDIWRGSAEHIDAANVDVVVRASLKETSRPGGGRGSGGTDIAGSAAVGGMYAFGAGGAYGLAGRFRGSYFSETDMGLRDVVSGGGSNRSITVSEKLDIHTRDGRVYQIDGDKFAFAILGEARGYTDRMNTDAMCEMLTRIAPAAVVDPYYSLWSAPSEHRWLRLPGMALNNDDRKFAFYSRWVALMYRHIMGAGPA